MNLYTLFKDYLLARKQHREANALEELKARYHAFRIYLENNGRALELLVNVDNALHHGEYDEIYNAAEALLSVTGELVDGLNLLSDEAHTGLYALHGSMSALVTEALSAQAAYADTRHYCISLDGLEPAMYPLAGTKAANLAQLRRMRLPVPDGFVCTIRGCRDFLGAGELVPVIRTLLRDMENGTLDMPSAASLIQQRILLSPFPKPLKNAMHAAYAELSQHAGVQGHLAISVRSSGVAEDRPDHSFAGQFTSVLNVMDPGQLLDAYREVIASGFSARAIAYRINAGLPTADFDLAVLCQRMTDARCAGVMMTRDPARPESGRLLLSAAPGLGTLAVGGSAPVDLYHPWRTDSGVTRSDASETITPSTSDAQPRMAFSGTSSEPTDAAISEILLLDGAEIAHKTIREISVPGGGLKMEAVPEHEADEPLLHVAELQRLVLYGEMIENLEGVPQDIEWAVAPDGTIHLLQARPLRVTTRSGQSHLAPVLSDPLVTGVCASSGKTVGIITIARNAAELQRLEEGELTLAGEATPSQPIASPLDAPRQALSHPLTSQPHILVLPQALVDAARHLNMYAGVIIDAGNPTDHLSCIAREYGIPLITAARTATDTLHAGQWVVLDADNGLVQDAPEHLWESFAAATSRPSAPVSRATERTTAKTESASGSAIGYADQGSTGSSADSSPDPQVSRDTHNRINVSLPPARRALWERLVPLNLTEAYGPTFSWQECRSVHDLVRYTHEMAVLAMFNAGDTVMEEAGGLLRPLDLGIPFHFLVIDLGGAVRRNTDPAQRKAIIKAMLRSPLSQQDILSVPLAALCEGLLTPNLSWHSGPDLEAVSGIVSRTLLDSRGVRPAGSFNYALAARDYLNLNARVEFHFAMLDAVCGGDAQANYIRFRFKGGGAGLERGHRRAIFLRHVLERQGFVTTVTGDLITASLTGASKIVVRERLVMLGRLLGFSRFLDGAMKNDDVPLLLAEAFLEGRYDSRTVAEMEAEAYA